MPTDNKLVAIVDYGMGNIRSVFKATEYIAPPNTNVIITQSTQDILDADAIIFPGQGAAKACLRALTDTGLIHSIQQSALEKPFLGICMGLQVLFEFSEENQGVDCLGLLSGEVLKFKLKQLKVPHMGWNQIKQTTEHPLWHKIPQDSRFYFVHSYYVEPTKTDIISGKTNHGIEFTSAVSHNNLFAIQAHPEKSSYQGLQLLKNFLHWEV